MFLPRERRVGDCSERGTSFFRSMHQYGEGGGRAVSGT